MWKSFLTVVIHAGGHGTSARSTLSRYGEEGWHEGTSKTTIRAENEVEAHREANNYRVSINQVKTTISALHTINIYCWNFFLQFYSMEIKCASTPPCRHCRGYLNDWRGKCRVKCNSNLSQVGTIQDCFQQACWFRLAGFIQIFTCLTVRKREKQVMLIKQTCQSKPKSKWNKEESFSLASKNFVLGNLDNIQFGCVIQI